MEEMEEKREHVVVWGKNIPHQAYRLALLGHTDREMAEYFEISVQTFNMWKRVHPELKNALRLGKDEASMKVVQTLYRLATGYEYDEEVLVQKGKGVSEIQTIHRVVKPSEYACTKFLAAKNRGVWGDSSRLEVTNTNINISKFDFTGLTREEMKLMEAIGMKQLVQDIGDS